MFSSRYGWRAATAAACLSLFLGVGSASRAADPEIDALRKQMEELKTRIDTFERERSTRPTEQPPARTTISGDTKKELPAAPAMDPGVQLASSWTRIERGMDRAQVEALIGLPRETLNIDGHVVWYYVYPRYGRGSVFFTGGQEVSSIQTPQFGWGR